MRTFILLVLLFSFLLDAAGSALPAGNYIIKGGENAPAVISVDNIMGPSSEAVLVRPYKADTGGIREELVLYRNLYLLFALFQGYVLLKAAAGQ